MLTLDPAIRDKILNGDRDAIRIIDEPDKRISYSFDADLQRIVARVKGKHGNSIDYFDETGKHTSGTAIDKFGRMTRCSFDVLGTEINPMALTNFIINLADIISTPFLTELKPADVKPYDIRKRAPAYREHVFS